tara:strand:- start:3150 stop:3815 length:666 start_codon:yes stop_codon:yes gene_type:complete
MIFDGWNEIFQIRGHGKAFDVCYRPMLKQERSGLLAMASEVVSESWSLIDNAAASHIEYIEGQSSLTSAGCLEGIREQSHAHYDSLVSAIMGTSNAQSDICFFDGLQNKVTLHLNYKDLLDTPCSVCCKYIYDPRSGEFAMMGNKRARRQPEDVLLCKTREGCPKGTFDNPLSWTDKERQVYRHDLECRKANQWPDDPIVKECKARIDLAYQDARSNADAL